MEFLSTHGNRFTSKDTTVHLTGVGLGNWLNIEHFMFGLPGSDSQLRQAIIESYGQDNATIFWDKYYSVGVQEADIKYIKQCGMNHVRIPVNYALFYTDSFEKSVAIREIDRVLAYCKKYEIWGIIDMHAVPGGQNPDWHSDNYSGKDSFWQDKQATDRIIDLWKNIAGYYKDQAVVGGYDLINEPCYFEKATDGLMIDFFKACTAAIRSVDKKHIIFYSGNVYSRDFSMFTENLDDNCSYTFHLYPFLQLPNDINADNIGAKLEESLNRDVTLEHLTQTLQKPLWCGETGHPLHMPDSYGALKTYLSILHDKHIGWALWPLKDAGALGMLYVDQDGAWSSLCKQLSNNWNFWNIFMQDSILSAQMESDKYSYYKWLAQESTQAWEVVRKNLSTLPFQSFLAALDDFTFDHCLKSKLEKIID